MPRIAATPAPPRSADLGLAWMEVFQNSALAWTDASARLAAMMMEAGVAQTKAFSELTAQIMAMPKAWPGMAEVETDIRSELLCAQAMAGRAADAVRETLADLGAADGGEAPPPLAD